MPFYEHVFLARQDLATAQVEAMTETFSRIIADGKGAVASHEYWGLRSLAYRIAKNRKALKSPAGSVAIFDYTSDGQTKTRLVAAILFAGGNSWFLKMVGDEGPVAASRADFIRLLESLRLANR